MTKKEQNYLSIIDILKIERALNHNEPNEALRLIRQSLPKERRKRDR